MFLDQGILKKLQNDYSKESNYTKGISTSILHILDTVTLDLEEDYYHGLFEIFIPCLNSTLQKATHAPYQSLSSFLFGDHDPQLKIFLLRILFQTTDLSDHFIDLVLSSEFPNLIEDCLKLAVEEDFHISVFALKILGNL